MQNSRQKIDLDITDQNCVSGIEHKLQAENGVKFKNDIDFVVEEQSVQFLKRIDYPVPESIKHYIFCALYCTINGCNLFLIF